MRQASRALGTRAPFPAVEDGLGRGDAGGPGAEWRWRGRPRKASRGWGRHHTKGVGQAPHETVLDGKPVVRDGGPHRGLRLRAAGRRLPALEEGAAETHGPRNERGGRRRGHGLPGRSPHAAARQVRRRGPPSAAPVPSPGQRGLRSPARSLRGGPAVRGRAGRSPSGGAAGRDWSSRWWNPGWRVLDGAVARWSATVAPQLGRWEFLPADHTRPGQP